MDSSNEIELSVRGRMMRGIVFNPLGQKTLVALHGWLDNAASFECLAAQLPDYKIIALEFMGHGHSDHRSSESVYYLWENVLDLYSALEQLELPSVTLLGHSMGASVAMLYAACFAERVERLCLIEGLAPLHYDEAQLPALMASAMRRQLRPRRVKVYESLDRLIHARANSRFSLSYEAARSLVVRGAKVTQEGVSWRSDLALLNPSVQRFTQSQILHFLSALQVPLLLVLGDEGVETPQWQLYYQQLTALELCRLSGNHHLHMYPEAAECIARKLVRFCEQG